MMLRSRSRAPRILLYSHDSFGLGHFRRSSAIARAIACVDPAASLLCVTGSPRPDLFPLPAGADYVKLPSVTKDDSGAYVPRSLDRDLAEVLRLRADTLETVARGFAPDVVLVDHAPLGVGGELLPMLRDQQRRGASLVLGMRDILDEPERARRELNAPAILEAMTGLYGRILVYGHPEVCDLAREYGLSPQIAEKLEYVGIACCLPSAKAPADRERPGSASSLHVVVTAGGGADGLPLLRPAVDALARGWEAGAIRATVVTGPFLPPSDHELLCARASGLPHLRLIKATSDLHSLLSNADLAITMGGYNSIYEALCMGVRVLALPRTEPRREQADRVRRLAGLGLLQTLSSADVTDSERLRDCIRDALTAPLVDARARGLRFEGAMEAARILVSGWLPTSLVDATTNDSGGAA